MALFLARQALAGNPLKEVALEIGWPPGGPGSEQVWISGRVEGWDQQWETTGPATGPDAADREETFTLKVICLVSMAGASYLEARDRALELAAEVARAVLSDDRLGGAVFESNIAGGRLDEGVIPQGRHVAAELDIFCRAYLS